MRAFQMSRNVFAAARAATNFRPRWFRPVAITSIAAVVLYACTFEETKRHKMMETASRFPSISYCAGGINFDELGFSATRAFFAPTSEAKGGAGKLQLVAAGMRRKNLFVVEVDVYKVGVFIDGAQDKAMKDRCAVGEDFEISLAPAGQRGVTLAIVLNFVRALSTKTIVDATVDALKDPAQDANYGIALDEFSKILSTGMQDQGMKVDEEIVLTFFGAESSKFGVVVGNTLCGVVDNRALRKSLADIYTGEKAIAQGVNSQLKQRYC